MELTQEQIKKNAIRHTMGTDGWKLITASLVDHIGTLEAIIYDIDCDDTLLYSKRTLCVGIRNNLKALLEAPLEELSNLESYESK